MLSLNLFFEHFKGEVFDAFIQIIPNFYSSEVTVEFTIFMFEVCIQAEWAMTMEFISVLHKAVYMWPVVLLPP